MQSILSFIYLFIFKISIHLCMIHDKICKNLNLLIVKIIINFINIIK